jgi:molybdopterin molybdotransferase
MISVTDALNKIIEKPHKLSTQDLSVEDSLGLILAEDVLSPIAMPPFSQSAMDGYAICGDLNQFNVVREIKAGDTEIGDKLEEGEACRIFTGAMIPENTTSIAKQEIVERVGDLITLTEPVKTGMSIRKKGEEIGLGELALSKGTKMNPAAIGLLSGLGIQKIKVYAKPSVSVLVTGNELTKAGTKLQDGKIYESNSFTLKACLNDSDISPSVDHIEDEFEKTKDKLNSAINNNDLVIVTGGISVGDYDFVGKALSDLGVEEVFYKVKQKPGKPVYYGIKGNTKIFALPGNPAAVLTCYYMYVLPAINVLMGHANPLLELQIAKMKHNFEKKGDRAFLLKGKVDKGEVEVHKGQSSAMLSSFVDANCLIFLEENSQNVNAGEEVKLYLLP